MIHDFAYGDIGFEGYQPPSFLSVKGAKNVGCEFTTMSKGYNMAGWRVGFAAGNRDMLGALKAIKGYYDYGIFQAVQVAAIVALAARRRGAQWRRSSSTRSGATSWSAGSTAGLGAADAPGGDVRLDPHARTLEIPDGLDRFRHETARGGERGGQPRPWFRRDRAKASFAWPWSRMPIGSARRSARSVAA